MNFLLRRIVVVGTISSGKSTIAKRLAEKLALNFIELDALHWEQGWIETPDETFRARAEEATRISDWVVEGNYHRVRDIIWPRAEAIIWLDYSLPLIFWRLTYRIFKRAITRELLWGKNIEPFWIQFKIWSEDSLYHWLFKTYWRRKREYPQLFMQPSYAHLKIFCFKSPRQVDNWLASMSNKE